MAYDEIKPRGSTKASRPDAGGAVLRSVPLFGIVKDNIDPTRSGRIKVLLSDTSIPTNSDDSGNWVPVSYLSNFFGDKRRRCCSHLTFASAHEFVQGGI